jgi:hypothetical protein
MVTIIRHEQSPGAQSVFRLWLTAAQGSMGGTPSGWAIFGQFSAAGVRSGSAGIVSKESRIVLRDYCTSAKHEGLQGVKDPRGLVGMITTRKRGLRCSQPPLGGLTK